MSSIFHEFSDQFYRCLHLSRGNVRTCNHQATLATMTGIDISSSDSREWNVLATFLPVLNPVNWTVLRDFPAQLRGTFSSRGNARSIKRAAIIQVIASRMLEYATRGRRSIYILSPGTLPEYSLPPPPFEITPSHNVCARACVHRLKVVLNFLRPRARIPCNPVALRL